MDDNNRLRQVWEQRQIPVILRPKEGRLRVRIPAGGESLRARRDWLHNGHGSWPELVATSVGKYWSLPKSWFNDLVERCLDRYRQVYIIQPIRAVEVCAPACWDAEGHICECSCLGANHGTRNSDGFFVVSDSFAVKWGVEQVAIRLLTRQQPFRCDPVERRPQA